MSGPYREATREEILQWYREETSRAMELEAENQQLTKKVGELEAEIHQLTKRLAATQVALNRAMYAIRSI